MAHQGPVAAIEYWLSAHIANWGALSSHQRAEWIAKAERALVDQAAYGFDRPVFVLDWTYTVLAREARYYCHREDFE